MQKGNNNDLSDDAVDIVVIVVVLLLVATILSLALSLPRIVDSRTELTDWQAAVSC